MFKILHIDAKASHLFSNLVLQSGNQHVNLNFRAINYSAELYLNGHKEILPKGMFRRHSLDITDILHLDGKNLLAVLVHPPDHPGTIPHEGGQGGDHEVLAFCGFNCQVIEIFMIYLFLFPNLLMQFTIIL